MNHDVYGYCPECGHAGKEREQRPDGNDTCIKGHSYPSTKALDEKDGFKVRFLHKLLANNGKMLDDLVERLKDPIVEDWVYQRGEMDEPPHDRRSFLI